MALHWGAALEAELAAQGYEILGQSFHRRLVLEPLSKWDSRRLVAEILQKVDHVPTTLRDLVVSGAEGNPFYVEEILRSLIDQRGVELARIGWWERSGIRGTLNKNTDLTFYVKHGDYLGRGATFLTVILLLFALLIRIIRKQRT